MKHPLLPVLALGLFAAFAHANSGANPGVPPEFTHREAGQWLNSPPLTLAGLNGSVVLIEFWTFDCINCRRSVPWLRAAYARYHPAGLNVIGVHTPELPQERITANVRRAINDLKLEYPVMIDADFSYWKAFDNQYWPAFYLLGRSGTVVEYRIGEVHPGDANARALESAIERELAKPR
jgi:thiol-disulfide isomerase/thioredoxin